MHVLISIIRSTHFIIIIIIIQTAHIFNIDLNLNSNAYVGEGVISKHTLHLNILRLITF